VARRQAAAEAAAARAAEASRRGPSAAELASMPALGGCCGWNHLVYDAWHLLLQVRVLRRVLLPGRDVVLVRSAWV
jgi:hypothetical protein